MQAQTHSSDYDAQGHRQATRGTVYHLKKGLLGNPVWKKAYGYCDERKLLIWSKEKPKSVSSKDMESQIPRAGFVISDSVFTESHDRLYAFTVTDSKAEQEVTLAVEDARAYEVWHELFTRESIRHKIQQNKVEKKIELQQQKQKEKEKVELRTRDDDIMKEFFRKRDISGNPTTDPIISTANMQKLMREIDPSVPLSTAKLACLELHLDPKGGSITMAEFDAWWKAYCSEDLGTDHIRRQSYLSVRSGTSGGNVGGVKSSAEGAKPAAAAAAAASSSNSSSRVEFGPCGAHYATFLDAELANTYVTRSELLSAMVPPLSSSAGLSSLSMSKKHEHLPHPEINEGDTWDDVYQRLVGRASQPFLFVPVEPTSPSPDVRNKPKNKTSSPGAAADTSRAPPSEWFSLHNCTPAEAVAACRTLAVHKGEFIKEAIAGARLLVDEYLLPLEEKTKGFIALSSPSEGVEVEEGDSEAEGVVGNGEGNGEGEGDSSGGDHPASFGNPSEEVYGFGGLIFRLAAVSASAVDLNPSETRSRFIAGADDLFHKIAGNEQRCSQAILQATREVYAESCDKTLKQAEFEAVPKEAVFNLGSAPGSGATATEASEMVYPSVFLDEIEHGDYINRPRLLLSTVVDYAGFRVTVVCPTHIDEQETLIYGSSPYDDVFVDSYPDATGGMLSRLADKMGLSLEKRVMATVTSAADAEAAEAAIYHHHLSLQAAFGDDDYSKSDAGSAAAGGAGRGPRNRQSSAAEAALPPTFEVEIFGRDLQVHECTQASSPALYLMNLRHALPSDLPRSKTNDLLTRLLRPEFVRGVVPHVLGGGPLSSAALASVSQDAAMSDADAQFYGDLAGFWEEYSSPSANQHLSACRQLYTQVIPALALELDELSTMPLDSHSLSRCFHAHGVSMRHLGVVHALARMPFVHSLLLCEAVARCCKTLLSKALRNLAREGRAATLVAEERGLSRRQDYMEFNKEANKKRKGLVLELFNVVLGSSAASRTFWQEVLPDVVFQKFGLEIDTKVDKTALLHLPQLCIALQYHLGAILQDRADYAFVSVEDSPIKDSDVLSSLLPAVKVPMVMPGPLGASLERAEALMGVKLFAEAASLLRLRLQLQQLILPDSTLPKHAAAVAETAYKVALCSWEQGDYDAVGEILVRTLASRPRFTAASARMLTLLMSAQMLGGHVNEAMNTFEEGQAVYMWVLGERHPACCVHLTALADCYRALNRPKHSLLMLSMAHEASLALLGETHLLSALYGAKIASLTLHDMRGSSVNISTGSVDEGGSVLAGGLHKKEAEAASAAKAMTALAESLRCFEQAVARGAKHLCEDLGDCLYALAVCPGQGLDEAAPLAERSAELVRAKYPDLCAETFEEPVVVSAIFLMAEAKLRRRDVDGCVALYERAWQAVRTRPTDYPSLGTTFALLSCRLLGTLFSSLALQTRSLLNTVAEEVAQGQHGSELPGSWQAACHTVFSALWEGGVKGYFQAVVDGLIQAEIESGGGIEDSASESKGSGGRRQSRFAASFAGRALEIAVITRLVAMDLVV